MLTPVLFSCHAMLTPVFDVNPLVLARCDVNPFIFVPCDVNLFLYYYRAIRCYPLSLFLWHAPLTPLFSCHAMLTPLFSCHVMLTPSFSCHAMLTPVFVLVPCDVNPFVPVPCEVKPFVLMPYDVNPFVPVPRDVNPCLWSRVKRCSQHGAAHPQTLQDPHSLRGPPGLEAARRKHAYRPPQGQGQDTAQKAMESGRMMMISNNSNDQSTRFTHEKFGRKKKKTSYTHITLHIVCFRKGPRCTSESFHGHQQQPRYSSPADPVLSGAGDVHVLFPGLQADQLRADLVGEEEDPGGQHLPAGPGR